MTWYQMNVSAGWSDSIRGGTVIPVTHEEVSHHSSGVVMGGWETEVKIRVWTRACV